MAIPSSRDKPLLFISHKHDDREIADRLRKFVTQSTGGAVAVYQSSSEQAAVPRAGFTLNQEIKNALWSASAFILVYTYPHQDWSYCMFEYGVANSPQSPNTRMILLRCCNAVPHLFAGQVNVDARQLGEVQKFTNQLLTDPDFFPDRGQAVSGHSQNDETVASLAASFFQDLQSVLPPAIPPSREEWPTYPFLQLELDASRIAEIKAVPKETRLLKASELILRQSRVTDFDREAARLFNSPGFDAGIKFDALVRMWSETDRKRDKNSRWLDALCRQILEGAQWQFPPLTWELLQGVNDDSWYAPIVTRVRRLPDQNIQFDIYFFRFEIDEANMRVEVGIPDA